MSNETELTPKQKKALSQAYSQLFEENMRRGKRKKEKRKKKKNGGGREPRYFGDDFSYFFFLLFFGVVNRYFGDNLSYFLFSFSFLFSSSYYYCTYFLLISLANDQHNQFAKVKFHCCGVLMFLYGKKGKEKGKT